MSDALKQKTRKSLLWNALDKAGFQTVAFVVGVITARLLDVRDFGLIGALAIFSALANVLVESGFVAALIRHPKLSRRDYSASFFCNLIISLVLYLGLCSTSNTIADFFQMPELSKLSILLFTAIPLNALGFVQQIRLSRDLDFKKLSMANLISAAAAGVITIILAIKGFSYWALAWQIVLQSAFRVLILWATDFWLPCFNPRWKIIREVLPYSIMILATNLMNNLSKYLYNLVIGRRYNGLQLGYFSQAQKYETIPTTVISGTVTGVAFPVLAKLNDKPERRKVYLRKLVRILAFLIFPCLLGFFTIAPQFIQILIGPKWLPAVPYLRILLLSSLIFPFQTLFLNSLNAGGQSSLSFRCEVLRNILCIAALFIGRGQVERMLWAYFAATLIAFIMPVLLMKRCNGYRLIEQIKDTGPYAAISVIMCVLIWYIGKYIPNIYWSTIVQIIIGAAFYLGTSLILGSQVMKDALNLILGKNK